MKTHITFAITLFLFTAFSAFANDDENTNKAALAIKAPAFESGKPDDINLNELEAADITNIKAPEFEYGLPDDLILAELALAKSEAANAGNLNNKTRKQHTGRKHTPLKPGRLFHFGEGRSKAGF